MVELLEEQGVRKASKASSALRELRRRSSLFSLASAPEASTSSSECKQKPCLKKSGAVDGVVYTVVV